MTEIDPPMRVSDDNLREYIELLELARIDRSKDPVANRYPWQCRAAILQLAKLAIEEQRQRQENGNSDPVVVRIRTDSFPDKIYGGEVADGLFEFKRQGGNLRILITAGPVHPESSSFKRFAACNTDKLKMRQEQSDEPRMRNHFLVVEELAYRYEAEHEKFAGKEFARGDFDPAVPARICFNEPVGAASLKKVFETLWSAAMPISLVNVDDQVCSS